MKRLLVFTVSISCFWAYQAFASGQYCSAEFEEWGYIVLPYYNPFLPNDMLISRSVKIRNKSYVSCSFRIRFVRNPPQASFESTVQYSITDPSGGQLLISEEALTDSSIALHTPEIPPWSQGTVAYSISVPRGQLASPNYYNDWFTLVAQRSNSDAELDRKLIQLKLPVASISTLNLSGGGIGTAVDFGPLETGAARSVILEATSNENYSLQLASLYQGRLRLEPPVSGQDWSIDYKLTIDGVPADLANEALMIAGNGPSLGAHAHTLSFEILETSNKRAGLYKDVITATIVPLH
jgi:hypothetical protein